MYCEINFHRKIISVFKLFLTKNGLYIFFKYSNTEKFFDKSVSLNSTQFLTHFLLFTHLLCKILGKRVENHKSGIFPQKFLPRVNPVVIVVAIPRDKKRNKIQSSTEIWRSSICCKGRTWTHPRGVRHRQQDQHVSVSSSTITTNQQKHSS